MKTITKEDLRKMLDREGPNNTDKIQGYALVNVLDEESFNEAHIPGSINIPKGRENEIERRFDKAKQIIVYCASPECSASTKVAEELAKRGFTNLLKYEGGMEDWTSAGLHTDHGSHAGHDIHAF